MNWGHVPAVLSLVWFFPAVSPAHPNHGASWGERYLKVDVGPDTFRAVYGLTFTARFGGDVRRLADGDGDGVVSAGEAETYSNEFASRLDERVKLVVDGTEVALDWERPVMVNLAGKARRGPLAVEVVASVRLARTTKSLTLEDRAEFLGIYRTTASMDTGSGVKLIRAGRGKAPTGRKRRVVFLDLPSEGPAPPRLLSLVVELPKPTTSFSVAVLVLVAIATVLFASFIVLVRRTFTRT